MSTLGEIEENEILTPSLVDYFESVIPDDSTIIEFKVNNINLADEDKHDVLLNIKNYVMFGLNATIRFSSCGLHVNGKNKIPHFHYHFICDKCEKPQNPSDHRKRYIKKRLRDTENWNLGDCSMKWQNGLTQNTPKYHILSYPLKENLVIEEFSKTLYIDRGTPMKKDKIRFLCEVGKTIYENALASNHRNDKCEERKKNKLMEIQEIVKNQNFANFREMVIWLDDNYIANLEIQEMPDFRNYKSNCEKVAVKLGILKYSQLF